MNILDRECQLRLQRQVPHTPRFPAIDIHTHFGKLFGVMVNSERYFDLYQTEAVVARIQSHGLKRIVNLDGGYGDETLRMMDKMRGTEDFVLHFGQVDLAGFESAGFETDVYRTVRTHYENGVKGLKFWKNIGLGIKDSAGKYLRPDDERLTCIWRVAAEFHMPVMFHIGDLNAFFRPADQRNEYLDTFIEHPDWLFDKPEYYPFHQLMQMQERLLRSNPDTTFIIPHVGSYAENLAQVGAWLDRYPNLYVDIADRLNELGRQPYTAKKFLTRYADRVLLGTDLLPNDVERYPIYWEFLETLDEYFPYRTPNGVMLGDWNIYGVGLEDETLQKIYYRNAEKILKM